MNELYRIENQITKVGLWYNSDGMRTDYIKSIENALAGDAPMDFDPAFCGWLSACLSLEQMRDWFSKSDITALANSGYELFHVRVDDFRIGNGHALFERKGALYTPVSFDILDGI